MTAVSIPLEGMSRSGGIRIIVLFVNALCELGHRVQIVVPDYASACPYPLHSGAQVEIVATGKHRLRKLTYLLKLCIRTGSSEPGCQAFLATSARTPWIILISRAVRFKRPHMWYLIQGAEHSLRTRRGGKARPIGVLDRCLAKWSYRLPAHHITVSTWLAEEVGNSTAITIVNPVDTSTFMPHAHSTNTMAPIVERPYIVGAVLRPGTAKGWNEIREAARALHQLFGDRVCFRFASSDFPFELPCDIGDAQILDAATDVQMNDFYNGLDVFVHASHMEGFGLPPLEAMACGIPVVVTQSRGVQEFCDEQNSLLIPVGDETAIVEAVIRLRHDPALASRLVAAGLRTVERFTPERHAAAIAQYLASFDHGASEPSDVAV